MKKNFIQQKITSFFPYEPNSEQDMALGILSDFLESQEPDCVLLFKGYAGTGKTTILGATVKMMDLLRRKVILLRRPAGRRKYLPDMQTTTLPPSIEKYTVNKNFLPVFRALRSQSTCIPTHCSSSMKPP